MSSYEEQILKILLDESIPFKREYSFHDLKNNKYRFDFYLPDYEICIECDGEQHFKYIPFFHKNITNFRKTKEHDAIKNGYALGHNLKLYRIPYWEFNNIKCFNDIIQDKFLVKTKYHNSLLSPL